MAKPDKPEAGGPGPHTAPTRTPDPWLLVARRKHLLRFPVGLLEREFADFPKSADGKPVLGPDATLVVEPGPNVLAAHATVFLHEDAPTTVAVRAEPPPSALRPVHLQAGHGCRLDDFYDLAANTVDVGRLEQAFLRVLRWLGDKANAPHGAPWQRFEVARGFDAPDLAVVRASALLGAGDDNYRLLELARAGAKWSKNEAHLGAAHDLAMRHGSLGANLAQACRDRHRAFQRT